MRNPTRFTSLVTCAAVLVLASCDAPPETTGPDLAEHAPGVSATANGGGQMLITLLGGFPGQFSMSNVQFDPVTGDATGRFHFTLEFVNGLLDFQGRTTCLTVDEANGRAWIGGVVTQNNSEDPAWQTERHQPGRDIWFRVVDYGEGGSASQSDRTTFVGFEGDAGIITSAEYCEVQPWPGPPDDVQDARTWPVTDGNIQVRVY